MVNISLIIVHWNSHDHLERLISGLAISNAMEIIVVDNKSGRAADRTLESLEHKKHVSVIRSATNVGFAAACNIGAAAAKGEWLLFMNPDIEIASDEILKFVDAAVKQGLDAASYQTSDPRYSKPLPSPLSLLCEFSPLGRLIPQTRFRGFTLVGGFFLVRRDVLNALGGWDESFFLWFEDSDLTKRLLDGGYSIGKIHVRLTHHGGVSFDSMSEAIQKNIFFTSMVYYADKHFSFIGKLLVRLLRFRFIITV